MKAKEYFEKYIELILKKMLAYRKAKLFCISWPRNRKLDMLNGRRCCFILKTDQKWNAIFPI